MNADQKAANYLLTESRPTGSETDRGYRTFLRAVFDGKETEFGDRPGLFGQGVDRAKSRLEGIVKLDAEGEIVGESTMAGNVGAFVGEFQGMMQRGRTNKSQKFDDEEIEEHDGPRTGVGSTNGAFFNKAWTLDSMNLHDRIMGK